MQQNALTVWVQNGVVFSIGNGRRTGGVLVWFDFRRKVQKDAERECGYARPRVTL